MILIVAVSLSFGRLDAQELSERLTKALEILKKGSETQSSSAMRYASDEIAEIFFHSDLMINRRLTNQLTTQTVSFLSDNAANLSVPALKEVHQTLIRKHFTIEDDDTYSKMGWVRGLAFSGVVNAGVHLGDRIFGRRLRNGIRRLAARGRDFSSSCRWSAARLGVRSISSFSFRHPRLLQYSLGTPSLAWGSTALFFGHYENWDASEDAVNDRILPKLEEIIERHSK